MRHNYKGRKLGTDFSHTKAMKKSLVAALFTNDRIKTVEARAKEIRPDVDFVLLGLALHGGETAKQRGHQRDTEKLLGSVHHFLLAGVWRPVFVLRKARRIPKIPFMMAVCYRLFLTGANAEILDKKTAEPPKSCFSGHQRVRPWRLSKA